MSWFERKSRKKTTIQKDSQEIASKPETTMLGERNGRTPFLLDTDKAEKKKKEEGNTIWQKGFDNGVKTRRKK